MALFDKFDSKKRARYLGCLRKGLRHGEACRAAGISRDTVYDYKKAHPEFQAEVEQAEADYCDKVEKYLLRAARKLNMTAIIFWLTNRCPERWSDRRAPSTVVTTTSEQDQALKEILERLKDAGKEAVD